MDNKKIANILYNYCLDMDYADSIELAEEEIEQLEKEINTIKELKLNSLLYVIEIVAQRNEDMEDWVQKRLHEE